MRPLDMDKRKSSNCYLIGGQISGQRTRRARLRYMWLFEWPLELAMWLLSSSYFPGAPTLELGIIMARLH